MTPVSIPKSKSPPRSLRNRRQQPLLHLHPTCRCPNNYHGTDHLDKVLSRAFRWHHLETVGVEKMNERIVRGSMKCLEGLAWGVVVGDGSAHLQEAMLGKYS